MYTRQREAIKSRPQKDGPSLTLFTYLHLPQAEGHGKVDAERYTRFASFPAVLTVHMKRFEFDFRTMNMCKVRG